jgi:hypothetical protein
MAVLDWTNSEILKVADVCARQVDHNRPQKTSSHAQLFGMVEAGSERLLQNAAYVGHMESLKVEK